jgi:hypothetical protein
MAREKCVKLNQKTETYRGSPKQAQRRFERDAKRQAKKDWLPVSERYEKGGWGGFAYIAALVVTVVLCLLFLPAGIVVGVFWFLYLLIVEPKGTMFVSYERGASKPVKMKTCPDCAEDVQWAARLCRFCGHEFERVAEEGELPKKKLRRAKR